MIFSKNSLIIILLCKNILTGCGIETTTECNKIYDEVIDILLS
jgi:hypothetical protein